MIPALAICTATGCSAARPLPVVCKDAPNRPAQLEQLELNPQDEAQASGVGYIDIETTSGDGKKMSRRCTMKVQPEGEGNARVHMFTAVHCLYAVNSDEFKNSKYTLQIFYNGGYFPASVEFDGLLQLNRPAQAYESYLTLLPTEQYRWNFTMSENSINFCVNRTKDFKTILGSTLKNIACFGKNDLRVLAGTISVQPQHLKAIDSIFDLQRKTSSNINSHLTDQEKLILKARDKNSLLPTVIPFYLKQVGYWISEKHCATSPADLPLGANGTPETQSLCPYRQVPINDLRTRFPEEFKIVSTVLNTPVMTLEELKTLHSSIFACSINSVADLDNFSGKVRTACDYENSNRYFWRRWVSAGSAPASLTNNPLWSLFGMNSDSYFALSYNQKSLASDTPRASVAGINDRIGSLSPESLNPEVMMLNFENLKNGVGLLKTDSGSILSIFGFLPVGTLTTVDGEATSGGASITPLPAVPPEDVSSDDSKKREQVVCK